MPHNFKTFTAQFKEDALKTQYVEAIIKVLRKKSINTLENVLDSYAPDTLTAEEMNSVLALFNFKVPERLLDAFIDGVNWKRVCCVQPIEFDVSQVSNCIKIKISQTFDTSQRTLYSESFLLRHADRLDYKQLSRHKFVSELLLNVSRPEEWDWRCLETNENLSGKFILQHADKFNWNIFTKTLFESKYETDLIDKLVHLMDWDVATICCARNSNYAIHYFDRLNMKIFYDIVSYYRIDKQLFNMIVDGIDAGKFTGPGEETDGWKAISAWNVTPFNYLVDNATKIDWSLVWYNDRMCLDEIEAYIDWNKLITDAKNSPKMWFDEKFLLRHIENGHLNWELVSTHLNPSEYIMSKYVDNIVWDKVPRDRCFSSLFLNRHRDLSKAYNLKAYPPRAVDVYYDTSRVKDFKWVCNFYKNQFPRKNIEQALKNTNREEETLLIFIDSFLYIDDNNEIRFAFPRVDASQFTEIERKRINETYTNMFFDLPRKSEKAYVKLVKNLPTHKYVNMFFNNYAWLDLSKFSIELEELFKMKYVF